MPIRKMSKSPSFHSAEKKARNKGLSPFFESVPMFLKSYRGAFLQLPWSFLMLTASSCFEVCVLFLHKCCIYTVFMPVYRVYICKNLSRMI